MDENKKYFAIAITRTCGSGGGSQEFLLYVPYQKAVEEP